MSENCALSIYTMDDFNRTLLVVYLTLPQHATRFEIFNTPPFLLGPGKVEGKRPKRWFWGKFYRNYIIASPLRLIFIKLA